MEFAGTLYRTSQDLLDAVAAYILGDEPRDDVDYSDVDALAALLLEEHERATGERMTNKVDGRDGEWLCVGPRWDRELEVVSRGDGGDRG